MSRPWFKSPYVVLICAVGIVFLAYGSRQSLGIFLKPITNDLGWTRESFSLVIGTQALIYGIAAPFVGAIADKWGPVRVLLVAAVVYSLGIFMMTEAVTPTGMLLSSSVLGGAGSAGCALSLVLAVASRIAPEKSRGLWLGIITSGGTGGQLVLIPGAQMLIDSYGWDAALLTLAVLVLLILPLALIMGASGGESVNSKKEGQSLKQALSEARQHKGFWLLVIGFFTCGFQVQFIVAHLSAYVTDQSISPIVAATALGIVGLFNMIGTWISGWLGDRYRKKYLLALLYFFRSMLFMIFILVPISPLSVYIFAASIGLLWLATVPLTSGIVFGMFGARYMATLYGIVFLGHQAGSFTSVWLGGFVFDRTGSYDIAWWIIIIGGALASLLHWPIDDRPVAQVLADRREASA
jgi:predicted MFS family arabinose efflux permease